MIRPDRARRRRWRRRHADWEVVFGVVVGVLGVIALVWLMYQWGEPPTGVEPGG